MLRQDGYNVSVVQNPTLLLEGDAEATRRILDRQDGRPCWSATPTAERSSARPGTYRRGGAGLYVAAFAPDKGESVNTLIADPPPGAPVPPILPPQDGFRVLDRDKFPASFAGDVPLDEAQFMADSQVPWGVNALAGAVSEPAWRQKPSWYLVTTEDLDDRRPPSAPWPSGPGATAADMWRSHSVYVSQPQAVADLIRRAAEATR